MLLPYELLAYESSDQRSGIADSVFDLGLLSDLLRVTSHPCHADSMFVNELSAGLALI